MMMMMIQRKAAAGMKIQMTRTTATAMTEITETMRPMTETTMNEVKAEACMSETSETASPLLRIPSCLSVSSSSGSWQ